MAIAQELPSDEQVLANLRFLIPELREVEMEMMPLEDGPFEGLHKAIVVINNSQQLPIVIDSSTSQLLLLLSPSILDISPTVEQVASMLEEEERQMAIADKDRFEALLRFSEGMASRGPDDAPVTIFEFSDFQCPYCANGFEVVEEVLERFPNDVRFVFLHYPLRNHDWAMPAAIASICAANQDHEAFWALHDSFFQNQRSITLDSIIEDSRGYLAGSSIDMNEWAECATNVTSAEYLYAETQVQQSVTSAENEFGVTGTPGFFVNGQALKGAQPFGVFEKIIQEVLNQ